GIRAASSFCAGTPRAGAVLMVSLIWINASSARSSSAVNVTALVRSRNDSGFLRWARRQWRVRWLAWPRAHARGSEQPLRTIQGFTGRQVRGHLPRPSVSPAVGPGQLVAADAGKPGG